MEIVVGVAIGALTVVIIFTSIGIGCLLRRKVCRKNKDFITSEHGKSNSDENLIDEDAYESPVTLQNVLEDELWVEDMAGVMDHCIPILKGCHGLTSSLVPVIPKVCNTKEESEKVEEVAWKVTPRIEDVVQLLDDSIDPRIVEARCTALFYSVTNLVLVIKSFNKEVVNTDWADASLAEIEEHLKILQEKTRNLRRRSYSGSNRCSGGTSSPNSETSPVSHSKTGSRASSSHTDSAESGIYVNTPSDQLGSDSESGKQAPLMSSYQPAKDEIDHSLTTDFGKVEMQKHFATAEVHREMESDHVELRDIGSMGVVNNAYHDTESST